MSGEPLPHFNRGSVQNEQNPGPQSWTTKSGKPWRGPDEINNTDWLWLAPTVFTSPRWAHETRQCLSFAKLQGVAARFVAGGREGSLSWCHCCCHHYGLLFWSKILYGWLIRNIILPRISWNLFMIATQLNDERNPRQMMSYDAGVDIPCDHRACCPQCSQQWSSLHYSPLGGMFHVIVRFLWQ